MSNVNKRFIALDSLRGVAALLVVLFHMAPWYPTWLMVDFFFVLSGFVLAHSYLYSGRKVSAFEFINHRIARLYPLHIFGLLFFIAAYVGTKAAFPRYEDGTLYTFLLQLTLTQNVGLHTADQPWNGPSWSISVEFWVSLLFFFYVSAKTRSSTLFFTAVLFLLIIYNNSGGSLFVLTKNYYGFINSGLLRGGCSFLLGVLTYRMYLQLQNIAEPPNLLLASVLELVVLAMAIFVVLSTKIINSKLDMLAPFVFMFVVLVFSCDGGVISKLLYYIRYLGTISYSIYLNHIPVVIIIVHLSKIYDLGRTEILYAVFATVIVISHFTYRYIEKPARVWVREAGDTLGKKLQKNDQ
jgi:peptidoglycan/LPS O-acetylase OafA/YrhL